MGDLDWKRTCTLIDRVLYLIGADQCNSQEFQTYLRIYGREKLEAIWKEHKAKMAPKRMREPGEDDD
jgi:hypothetical protein